MRVAVLALAAGCGRIAFDASATGSLDATELDGALTDAAPPLTVTRLLVQSASSNQVLGDITAGGSLSIANEQDGVGVIAEVAGAASVSLVRNGVQKIEGEAPWASGGDELGIVNRDQQLVIGTNTLAVTAYEMPGLTGASGPTYSVTFVLELPLAAEPSIAKVELVDDTDNAVVVELTPTATPILQMSTLPAELEIIVTSAPGFVGSVCFAGSTAWDGRCDNWEQYTAIGPNGGFAPALGTYTATLTAYPLGNGLGDPGQSITVAFDIVP